MFRVPFTESATIYNFRSRKNVVEPRYNEGQRNKQNKRSLYRGFVVSRIVIIILLSSNKWGKTYILPYVTQLQHYYLNFSKIEILFTLSTFQHTRFSKIQTHEPSNTVREKLDLHKFTRCKYGAKKCKLGGNQQQR